MSPRNPSRAPKAHSPSSTIGSFLTKTAFLGLVGGAIFGEQARAAVPSVGTITEVSDVNTSSADQFHMVTLSSGQQVYIEGASLGGDTIPMVIDPSASTPTASELCGSGTFGSTVFETVTSIDLGNSSSTQLYVYVPYDLYGNNHLVLTDSSTGSDFSSCGSTTLTSLSTTSTLVSYGVVSGTMDETTYNGTDNDITVDGATDITTSSEEIAPGRCDGTNYLFYQVGDDSSAEIYVRDITDTTSDTLVVTGGAGFPRCDAITGELNFSYYDGSTWNLYSAPLTYPSTIVDADGDGYDSDDDCDDTDSAINPGATEVCDGVDNNCDGTTDTDATDRITVYTDNDQDGLGTGAGELACEADDYQSEIDGDCDDNNAEAQNWETGYLDRDGDGYGDAETASDYCPMPEGVVSNNSDCDDDDSSVWEGEQCAPTEEGPSSATLEGGETITLSDGSEVSGSGATLEVNEEGVQLIITTEGGYVFGVINSPLIVSYALESDEYSNAAEAYFPMPEGVNDVEIFGGMVEGADSSTNDGGSSSNFTGTEYGSEASDFEGSEDDYGYGEDTGFEAYLPATAGTEYASSTGEDNEFNECDSEGFQVNLVDAGTDMGWAYLCIKSSIAGHAIGADLEKTELTVGQMNEIADIYSCPTDGPDELPDDTGEKNPSNGTNGGNNPEGCSTTGTTPTGRLAVMAGFLLAAAGRRRKRN